MTDKIAKFLQKLHPKDLKIIKEVILLLSKNQIDNLNVKKLKGSTNIYRARKGNIRIIFSKEKDVVKILQISKRDDQTYSKY
jgi:mRNA-degrading endonuclease RelE of RelBE toxin-antitoxin system